MKFQIYLVFFIILNFQHAYCQEDKNEFSGTLQLNTKEIITFKLQYKVLPTGEIEGTSLTDIFGSDRTLCKIKGKINKETNKISFEEIGNISTKSNAELGDFCFIKVENASIKIEKGKKILKGNFTGYFQNGQKCTSGFLYLISKDYIDQLAQKYLNKDQQKNIDSLLNQQQQNTDVQAKIGSTYLKNNQVMRLNWTSSEIIIEVSDGSRADGDEIAIYVNGKKILDSFVITNEKKTIVVPFTESKGSIRIQALNEGTLKSCTTNLTLIDADKNTNVVANMDKGANVIIVLNKIPAKNGNKE
ncbi:MAG: hypothetical protein K9I36_03620 [Bacteroidia bacterium]|nr:hypothetical protein [Bacteroidia bacterium]MCF8425797.1 hypothetical protein [Bacteroidia bacterium]